MQLNNKKLCLDYKNEAFEILQTRRIVIILKSNTRDSNGGE